MGKIAYLTEIYLPLRPQGASVASPLRNVRTGGVVENCVHGPVHSLA